jgi:hypothetical protein
LLLQSTRMKYRLERLLECSEVVAHFVALHWIVG